jgi:pre-rRNA-processing protein TSR1
MQISVVGRETGKDSDVEISEGEESLSDQEVDDDPNLNQPISHKHTKFTDLESRAREDMDFPDEVDTPFVDAKVRFQNYRGIKSLKNCDWDPYENLPAEYSKVWRFQQY